jgi:hypothetical protein
MAKWTNEGKSAVVVMHHLVLPGETVDVPEKMLKILPEQALTLPSPKGRGGNKKQTVAPPPPMSLPHLEDKMEEGEEADDGEVQQ